MRGNAVRALLSALAVLGLLALVAIAARGSTSAGSGETHSPSYVLFDTALGVALVALLAWVVLMVYVFGVRTPTGFERQRGSLVAIAAIIAFAAVIGTSDVPAWIQERLSEPNEQRTAGATPNVPEDDTLPPDRPAFTWLPMAVILALAATGAAATLLADRRRRGAQVARTGVEEAVVDVLDDILDDLRAETDARRAVIAAYARLERVLAAHGLAREASETQEEYLARILGQLDVDFRSIRRLTDLFAVAKFSQHVVDVDMKEEAIDILEHIRNELDAAEAHDGGQRLGALPAGPA
jgi:hypothetical protein